MDSMTNIILMALMLFAITSCRKGRSHRLLVEAVIMVIYIAAVVGNKDEILGYLREIASGKSVLGIVGATGGLITIAALGFMGIEGLHDITIAYKMMTLWDKMQEDEKSRPMIEVIPITDDGITNLVKIKDLGNKLADEIEACGIKAGKLKELADQLHSEIRAVQCENKENI